MASGGRADGAHRERAPQVVASVVGDERGIGQTINASVLQLGHIVATDANDPASRDLLATVLILLECVGCA